MRDVPRSRVVDRRPRGKGNDNGEKKHLAPTEMTARERLPDPLKPFFDASFSVLDDQLL